MNPLSLPWTRLRLFWLINYPLFCLLFISYARHHALAQDGLSVLYFIGLSLAQAGFFSLVLLIVVPAFLYWLSGRKIPILFLSAFFAVFSLYYFAADSFAYSQFRTHLNWTLLAMMLSPARTQIFDLTGMDYLALAVVLGVIITSEGLIYKFLPRFSKRAQQVAVNTQIIIVLLIIVIQGTYAWADAIYEPRILLASELSPGFYGATAKRFLARHHLVDVSQRPATINNHMSSKIYYPKAALELNPLITPPNILMIAIDAWRYDSFNPQVTPQINSFARHANLYENHYSGGNSTRAGLFSLFYSVSPGEFDAFYRVGRGPVLFDILYQQGYQVGVYSSASALSPPFHRTTFVNVRNFDPSTPGKNSIERDKAITNKVMAFARQANQAKQPYFAFVFYDSAHAYNYPKTSFKAPFQPAGRVSHLNLANKKQQQLYRNQYRNALYYVDSLVGEILHDLRKQGTLENTVVIITADHGEEFDDNGLGYWGHNGNFTPPQTHVPLLVFWPGQKKMINYQHITSHYDIAPTLLHEVLGVKNSPADYSLGRILNDLTARQIILMGSYGKMAFFIPEQALLAVTNRLGMFHLEDLHGMPLIKTNLAGQFYQLAFAQMNQFHGV